MRKIFFNLNMDESPSLRVLFLSRKRDGEYDLSVKLSNDENLSLRNGRLVLLVDEDTREQAIYLLDGYINNGYFPIAEFCQIDFDYLKNDVMLYFHGKEINENQKSIKF
ncbi:hypothetical protein V8J88_10860 [Massilia sp. W12]|uniref:hypothetical protein n=1 Tax=Massilia sp. W12 TaxID=3126507 RepID=UPI0030CC4362